MMKTEWLGLPLYFLDLMTSMCIYTYYIHNMYRYLTIALRSLIIYTHMITAKTAKVIQVGGARHDCGEEDDEEHSDEDDQTL